MDNSKNIPIQQNTINDVYTGNYVRSNCAEINSQQSSGSERAQNFLPYSLPMPATSSMSQSLMYSTQSQPLYNIMYGSQGMYTNQNSFPPSTFNTYTSQVETAWFSDSCITATANETIKLKNSKPDKITNEKISPQSCCSSNQLESIAIGICSPLSDTFKALTSKDTAMFHNKPNMLDSQWYYGSGYNSQKYNDLPSCSQLGQMDISDQLTPNQSPCCRDMSLCPDQFKSTTPVKYCSIQKSNDVEHLKNFSPTIQMPPFVSNNKFISEPYSTNLYTPGDVPPLRLDDKVIETKNFPSCQIDGTRCELEPCEMLRVQPSCLQDSCASIAGNCDLTVQNNTFFPNDDVNCMELYQDPDPTKLDITKPESQCGGESDIIVEDSDDDSTDISDDCDRNNQVAYTCAICNVSSSGELIYFCVGEDTLLTSTTQTPIVKKIVDIIKYKFPKSPLDHICNVCLNLINTVDCLEAKLERAKKQLFQIFQKTNAALGNIAIKNNDSQYILNEPVEKEKKIGRTYEFQNSPANKESSSTLGNSEEAVVAEVKLDTEQEPDFSQNKRICKICNKYFCQSDVHKHKQLHANHISFKCTLCHRSFTMKRLLDNHMRRHSGQRDFLCDRCGRTYTKKYSLEMHVRRHEKQYSYYCEVCKRGFVCYTSLEAHRRTHSDIKRFDCKICQKKFRTNTNLQEHVRYCSGDLPFQCEQCDKKFATSSKLNDHVKLKHDKVYKFLCGECKMGFIIESHYKAHLTTHSDEKPFKCEICGKCYKTLGNLNHHKIIHKELPFKCEICDKGFKRRENFEIHKNNHSGLKPFTCSVCDKKFAAQKFLDQHSKLHSGNVKKKICKVCNKQLSHGLADHMRLHSGIKMFKCNVCSVMFITNGALRKHIIRKHKEK